MSELDISKLNNQISSIMEVANKNNIIKSGSGDRTKITLNDFIVTKDEYFLRIEDAKEWGKIISY